MCKKLAAVAVLATASLLSFSVLAQTLLTNTPVGNAPVTNGQATNAQTIEPPGVRFAVSCTVGNAAEINGALATAQTPQQAARLFAKIISPAIGQAIANAVQQALARTDTGTTINPQSPNSQIQGWQLSILQNGLSVQLNWPSPGLATAGNLPVSLLQARAPSMSGALLDVSVSGTF
jgi:hypothetical protein